MIIVSFIFCVSPKATIFRIPIISMNTSTRVRSRCCLQENIWKIQKLHSTPIMRIQGKIALGTTHHSGLHHGDDGPSAACPENTPNSSCVIQSPLPLPWTVCTLDGFRTPPSMVMMLRGRIIDCYLKHVF